MRPPLRYLAFASWALLAVLPGCAQTHETPLDLKALAKPIALASPRLTALRERLLAGHAEALAAFWDERKKEGTPLVETVAGDDGERRVTFLYRGGRQIRNVVILGSIAHDAPMERLPGTDLWFKSFEVRKEALFTYRLAPNSERDAAGGKWVRFPHAQPDPLNLTPHPPSDPLLSRVSLPDAPPQPWLAERPGVAAGKVVQTSLRSAILKEERPVWIYTPAGYDPHGGPYPLLLVLDGSAYLELIALPRLLDNLIAAGKLPPVVALLEGRLEAPSREASLSCRPDYARYLAEELLPWAVGQVRIGSDPARTVIAGSSMGGLAAACAALDRPDRFGNVVAQSGAFWWKPEGETEFEAVERRIEASPRLALRLYLDVGTFEIWPAKQTGPSLLEANRHLHAALQSKGYDVRYLEYVGGHGHANWQATLPDALIGLLGTP